MPARISIRSIASQVAARQYGEILRREQVTREGFVVALDVWPQVETAIRLDDIEHRLENRDHVGEFLAIQGAILCCMIIVIPRRDACQLRRDRHRTAVVGPVKEKGLDQRRIASDETRAQSGYARSLRERVKNHATLEFVVTALQRRLEHRG